MPPREVFTEIESRTLSGRGLLELPQESEWRWFRLWVNVFRLPSVDFPSSKWNPERSEYAKITYIRQEFVWKEETINYTQQTFDLPVADGASYLGSFLVCALESISTTLAAVGVAVGLPPPTPGDIAYAEPVAYDIDSIRFVCREDVGLQVTLFGVKYDVACTGATPNPKNNINPGTLEPSIPPGTPTTVSSPYTPPDDDGNTVPASIDPVTSQSGTWSFTFQGDASPTVFSNSAPGFADDNPGILTEVDTGCLNDRLDSIYSQTRNVRYYPTSTQLSTCQSGAMIILTQNFVPD